MTYFTIFIVFFSGETNLDVEVAASGFTKEMQKSLEEVRRPNTAEMIYK